MTIASFDAAFTRNTVDSLVIREIQQESVRQLMKHGVPVEGHNKGVTLPEFVLFLR